MHHRQRASTIRGLFGPAHLTSTYANPFKESPPSQAGGGCIPLQVRAEPSVFSAYRVPLTSVSPRICLAPARPASKEIIRQRHAPDAVRLRPPRLRDPCTGTVTRSYPPCRAHRLWVQCEFSHFLPRPRRLAPRHRSDIKPRNCGRMGMLTGVVCGRPYAGDARPLRAPLTAAAIATQGRSSILLHPRPARASRFSRAWAARWDGS